MDCSLSTIITETDENMNWLRKECRNKPGTITQIITIKCAILNYFNEPLITTFIYKHYDTQEQLRTSVGSTNV